MANITEKKIFIGIINVWLIGIPLILVIIYFQPNMKSRNKNQINFNFNKFANPQQIIVHCNFILRLIYYDWIKSTKHTLLNGYIEFHNKICLDSSCVMKKIKFYSLYSKKKGPKQKFLPNKIDKWYIFCYEAIEKMYLDGISAFS
jgi:hypothetical protein